MDYQQQPGGIPPMNSGSGRGLGIASLVLGIIALVFAIFFSLFVPWINVILAIVGIVLGVVGSKRSEEMGEPTNMAKAGIALSIVALAWTLLFLVVCGSCITCLSFL